MWQIPVLAILISEGVYPWGAVDPTLFLLLGYPLRGEGLFEIRI